ncbi:MAG: tetratricopeptide repeat protein [Acidobacteriia bacterium]|nr:tetratricopeptide repeat protein [Terriglobia bacterium]
MLLALSSPMVRRTLLLAAVVLAGTLSFFAVRFAAAEYFSSLDTLAGFEEAVRLEPGNARHWHLLGRYWQFGLDQQDFPRAIELYRHSLLLDPRAPAVWLDLASAYETQGDLSSARSALLSAKKSHPVSAEVAWHYGNFLLRQGEMDSAFAEIHRSLESDPSRTAEAVSVCWSANPDSQVLLGQVLPSSPVVYLAALQVLAADGAVDASLDVWNRLAALHPHFPLQEASPFLDLLLRTAHGTEAAQVWKQALEFAEIPDPGGPSGSVLWDGGFESNVRNGLSWRIQEDKGVQIGYDGAVKHSGRQSLRIHFDGSRNLGFSGVCQVVPVTPLTAYQFSGWMRTETITSDRGIFVALSSRDSPSVSTPELRATEPWTPWTLSWQAGKDSRIAQICVSRAPSQKFDNKIAGTAWLDDLALVPLPAAPSPEKVRP